MSDLTRNDNTSNVEHKQVAGSVGGPGECGVECACGTGFDGFDTMAEANAILDSHIEDERLKAESQRDWKRLAEHVIARRTELGLRQIDIPERGGPSLDRVQAIESGRGGNFRPSTLRSLADALGLPRAPFFKAAGLAPFTPEAVARVAEVTRRESTLNALVQASVGAGVMRVLSGGRYPSSIQGGAS